MISEVVALNHSDRATWKHFPDFLHRLEGFCRFLESSVNVPALTKFCEWSFVADEPTALMLVGLDEDGFVCGHLLAIAELWFGTKVVTVVQIEVDKGTIFPEPWRYVGSEMLTEFANKHQATIIQIAARNRAVARLFQRQYGFKEDRILMKRPVEGRDFIPSR